MTLDEAIEHAEQQARDCSTECRREHAQLAEWLRELRDMKAQPACEYGATDFGHTFAGIELTEGDKRLMSLLVSALGTAHPAIDDMTALLFRAAGSARRLPSN